MVSVCTSGRRCGTHPSSDGSPTGTPRADLGKASFSPWSHSPWMNFSSSFSKKKKKQKNQKKQKPNKPFFKLENLSSVEERLIRSCPSQCGCLCRLTIPLAGVRGGAGWGGTSLETKGRAKAAPTATRACGLLPSSPCYDL